MKPQNIACNKCGTDAIPAHIEIVSNPDRRSEIVDLILWIDCPNCGPQKQPPLLDPIDAARLRQDELRDYGSPH